MIAKHFLLLVLFLSTFNPSHLFAGKKKSEDENIYQRLMKILHLDCAKAPGLNDREGVSIRSIQTPSGSFNRGSFRASPNVKFAQDAGITYKELIDAVGIRTIIACDASEKIRKISKYSPSVKLISDVEMEYDVEGNKILEKHTVVEEGVPVRTFTLHWTYDLKGRLLSTSEGDGAPIKTTRYLYDDDNRIFTKIKADGTSLTYCYSEDWLLRGLRASDNSVNYLYHYDEKKRLIEVEDLVHHRKQTRRYGNSNELIEESIGPGVSLTHDYDDRGHRIHTILPDKSHISYVYQGESLVRIERKPNCHSEILTFEYAYDSERQPIRLGLSGKSGSIQWSYHKNGQLASIESPWWCQSIVDTSNTSISHIVQSSISDCTGSYEDVFEHSYDGQLSAEKDHHYLHDSLWNRIEHNGETWETNSLNQLVRNPQASCTYDDNGCLSSKQTIDETYTYAYDALDRLIRVEKDGQIASEYIYDYLNRQIERHSLEKIEGNWEIKTSDRYLYDGLNEIGKIDLNGNLAEFRLLGHGYGAELGAAVLLELNGHSFFPVHDHRGSVRCLVDIEREQIVESYTYSSYREDTCSDGQGGFIPLPSLHNSWRFYSKRMDEMSHLVNFGSRWYDPQLARWITPDPLFSQDCSNLYAFVKNDPVNLHDLFGLFSVNTLLDWIILRAFSLIRDIQTSVHQYRLDLHEELKLPQEWKGGFELVGRHIFGDSYELVGHHHERTRISSYGEGEISDKVRVTFINGILSTRAMVVENLELISRSHGNVNVHYVFRPTEGWVWDISRALLIKTTYWWLGFRSMHAYILANLWKELIQEMGGVDGGGTIIHYAHSLGATETDRARELLTPEQQKMIRVITCGPATYIRNVGFGSAVNHVSIDDGVGNNYIFEPIGLARYHFQDPLLDVRFHGDPYAWPLFLMDHGFCGTTYGPIIEQAGIEFLEEFGPTDLPASK